MFVLDHKDLEKRPVPGRQRNRDYSKWKKPVILLILLIIFLLVMYFVAVFQFNPIRVTRFRRSIIKEKKLPKSQSVGRDDKLKGFIIKTDGCRIPDLNPFDPAIQKYIFKRDKIKCNEGKPALMDSNLTSIFIINKSIQAYNITNTSALNCCYQVFERCDPKNNENDVQIQYRKDCIKFQGNSVIKDEFIEVNCKYYNKIIYTDMFSFVPIKSKPSAKSKSLPLNVLVVGLDAVSRLNFHRQMPKTVKVLENLQAVELLGFNKIGDNTFPNLIGVLTGYSADVVLQKYYNTNNHRFDKCPFIWQKYKENGYATAFGEDAAWMGLFNYNLNGFIKQPTDYFWSHFSYHSESKIGSQNNFNSVECVGARISHTNILQYTDKFVQTMDKNKMPYFGFFWSASLTHDYLNKPNLGDDDFSSLFNRLNANGNLKNTVLIVMSDHGIRWGGILGTYQGKLEERLPFVFIALPQQFRDRYKQAFKNLRENSRRFTTAFDLYETFKSFLNLKELTAEKLNKRAKTPKVTRGYSLFDPIPLSRTCKSADIASDWCACQNSEKINISDPIVKEATQFTIDQINKQLEGYPKCAKLSLAEIYNASLYTFTKNITVGLSDLKDFTITFSTAPGNASFEATVRQNITGENIYHFSSTGEVSRINSYKDQSACITDLHLKVYCYCKK